MSNTRGKSRPVAVRAAEAAAKAEELNRKARIAAIEQDPANAAFLASASAAVKAANIAVNDAKRFIKIGPDKVQDFKQRVSLWENRISTSTECLPSLQSELAQAKAEYAEMVESLAQNQETQSGNA